jgi:hypothetical protein
VIICKAWQQQVQNNLLIQQKYKVVNMADPKGNKDGKEIGTIATGALALLADTVGLGYLAYDVIVNDQVLLTDSLFKFIFIIIVFFVGVGLGMIGLRGGMREKFEDVLIFFLWAFLMLTCLTYLGVVAQLQSPYVIENYISYVLIIVVELSGFLYLKKVTQTKNKDSFWIALSLSLLFHIFAILKNWFINDNMPSAGYAIGEILILMGWIFFTAIFMSQRSKTPKKRRSLR